MKALAKKAARGDAHPRGRALDPVASPECVETEQLTDADKRFLDFLVDMAMATLPEARPTRVRK